MNTIVKMRMLTDSGDRDREYGRNESRGGDYRSAYEGRYSPMRSGYDTGVESRFRDRTGREHYDNGRFAPTRSEYGGGSYGTYAGGYEAPRMGDDDEDYRRKWTITENRGMPMMAMDGGRDWEGEHAAPQYRGEMNDDGMRRIYGFGVMDGGRRQGVEANYHGPSRENEMGWRRGGEADRGYSHSAAVPPLTREMAEEWMRALRNEDGTTGPHWSLEQVKQLLQQRGIQNVDPLRVWVAMNADYSDRVAVNRKYGLDKPDYYLDAALAAWINDKDAVEHKEAAYYMYVVK